MFKTQIGKLVFDIRYFHISTIESLEDVALRTILRDALQGIKSESLILPNVAKINQKTGKFSLLAYSNFDTDPFPRLLASWSFAAGTTKQPVLRTYEGVLNVPILHRKELLVHDSYPGRDQWVKLTLLAESLGLFDETRTIGFSLNWERCIESKGYRLNGNSFHPLGNALDVAADTIQSAVTGAVHRHLTALVRSNLSAPVQLLLRHRLLHHSLTFFDYGCGRGGDVATLLDNGIDAHGWDPHFAPDNPTSMADAVNLGFVINVIEDPAERVEALHKAFALTRRVMSIGCMLYSSDPPGKRFQDGFITSRNTFQKYFSQAELKDYIEQVLHHEAFMVGPGVAFVFVDKVQEQSFNYARFRSRSLSPGILSIYIPKARKVRDRKENPIRVAKPNQAAIRLDNARTLLDPLWKLTLELGRFPEPQEVVNLEEIDSNLGSLRRAIRLLSVNYNRDLLASAEQARSDDIRLYMAAQQFEKRPAYRQLQTRLQLDVKAFFGDYRSAQAAGMRLLQDAANSENILAACKIAATAGLGWLENEHSLQLHLSLVDRLPAVLRAYVVCGLILWDATSEVQLIKIHVDSGKLTFMEYDDFDTNPLPTLRRRIKVNVRRQDYDVFEYGSLQYPKPLLYFKSRYLHEDYTGYAEQFEFDDTIERMEIVKSSELGPPTERLYQILEQQRLGIHGMQLSASTLIPPLDQQCGEHFTFGSLIKCGETQQRLGIANRPLNPATYNALFALATQILDPIIDYFGSIRLTYGFCSPELGNHIHLSVAPKLDQHASFEVGRNGKLICNRGGAACDFLVEDENMYEVASWIIANLPFDRLYFYGPQQPIHVSYSRSPNRAAFQIVKGKTGHLMPRKFTLNTS